MNTTYAARKVTLTDSFKERAELKLKKLDKFFDDAKAQVTVSTQKNQATVELTVWANNLIFRSEAKNEDKLEALDEALENLIRRIRKNKTKLQKKVKASGFEILAEEMALRDMDGEPLTRENYDQLMARIDEYLDEFDAHGTDHISVDLDG